uniref:Uncharacterized protein n=1 Tax=Acrobeloides nanus TaxID=290746 RepID=A0A914CQZ6_9BILA
MGYPCIVDGQGRSWYPNSPWLFDSYYLRASCDRGACATYIFQDNSKRTCSIPVGYGLTNGTATRSYLSQFSDCVSPIVNPIDSTYSACGYINVRSISCHLFPCTKPIGCPFAV